MFPMRDVYGEPMGGVDQCPLCCLPWHGLPANRDCPEQGCPSVFGTEEQIAEWKDRHR